MELNNKKEVQELEGTAKDPWGTFRMRLSESGRWRIGPSCIWIKRSPKEWLVAVDSGRDYLSVDSEVTIPVTGEEWPDPEHAEYSRYAFSETRNQITLWPELSPRSVVFSPETPVSVTPGEQVTLYVSTPLWVRLETGDPPVLLKEFPAFRPSDTWFGQSTIEGEHCFAVKMAGRLHLDDLPTRVHRAVTPIQIRNRGDEALRVEQVRLPVQFLSLYRTADRMLWTQPVVLESQNHQTGAVLHLKERFDSKAEEMQLVRSPREEHEGGIVSRAWHWFFRK